MSASVSYLFGGDRPWSSSDWASSDDRVRGGSSFSKLDCPPTEAVAVFSGTLDIKTLGGAGFASQRTTKEDRDWNLFEYDGLLLDIKKADAKRYTFILKDEVLPRSPNGREQSTISWEYDFKPQADGEKVTLRWNELKPTYRGREKKDSSPLDLKHIKRISIMVRSFFGTQEGNFTLSIGSIAAFKEPSSDSFKSYVDEDVRIEESRIMTEKGESNTGLKAWVDWLRGYCMG